MPLARHASCRFVVEKPTNVIAANDYERVACATALELRWRAPILGLRRVICASWLQLNGACTLRLEVRHRLRASYPHHRSTGHYAELG